MLGDARRMRRTVRRASVLTAFTAAAIGCAIARASGPVDGIYGKLDLRHFASPEVINAVPVAVSPPARGASRKPVFLHVQPGEEKQWSLHCGTYKACSVPVHFVTERWFVEVYLPAVGSQDGREQWYRLQMKRDRESERDVHEGRHD
jgi:hypothetical protein